MSGRIALAGIAVLVALPLGIILLLSPANPAGGCGAGAGVPVTSGQLTSGQQQFAGELAARTGLDGDVVAAWELAEESGSHAIARAAADNNDWLNVGYTDSGTYGSTDSVWSDPVTAADATAGWLQGEDTIPGYGTASTAVQAILTTAGQPAAVQIAAIQDSGWASSGYPDLPGLYASVATAPGASDTGQGAVPVSAQVGGIDQTTATSYITGLGAGVQVGYAVVSAGGQVLAQHDATMQVPGASITKAMLLVAYLEQLGNRPVPPAAQAELGPMIEISDNTAGSWTFAQVGAAAVEHVAVQAGMTGFALDTSDPVYTLGQSLITALDFARLFASIDQLMPATNRAYGMGLLENISAGDHWGILDAGIGVTASKAGWKTEPDGEVVNQAAQLQLQGQAAGIAVVSEGEGSQGAGETIMQTVASDLLAAGGTTAASGVLVSDPIGCGQPSGTFVSGGVASILPDGQATIPQGAPQQVQQAIAAGNALINTFYSQERRANMLTQVQDSYDCSGSTDFVLYNAGLSSPQVDVGDGTASDSTALQNYDQTGPGQWITVYANPGHAFIEIAGLVLDTAYYSSVTPASVPDSYPPDDPDNGGPASGPRWQPASIIPAQVRDDVHGWFDERHPAGL